MLCQYLYDIQRRAESIPSSTKKSLIDRRILLTVDYYEGAQVGVNRFLASWKPGQKDWLGCLPKKPKTEETKLLSGVF
jgi:hypothetical protein